MSIDPKIKTMVRLSHDDPEHEKILLVNWLMGNECNYRCAYCPPELNGCTHPWVTLKEVDRFTAALLRHPAYGNGKKLYFCLNGGEVTLHPELPEICRLLNDRGCGVGILSNGSGPLSLWKILSPLIDHACLSFHPLFAPERDFADLVAYIHNHTTTHVNIMMHPDCFEQCRDFAMRLVSQHRNFTISFPPLMKMLGKCSDMFDYSEAQRNEITILERLAQTIPWDRVSTSYRGAMKMEFSDGSSEAVSPGLLFCQGETNFRHWFCNAGLEMLSIYYNGDIYPAWCFEGEKRGRIGNILDSHFTFPDAPVECPFDICWDNSDIMMTKTAPLPDSECPA